MSTLTLAIEPNPSLDPRLLDQMAQGLRAGAVAIFPTETVYGMGTSAFSLAGIQKIYSLKGRDSRKPLAILVPSLTAATPLVESVPPEAMRLAAVFCPGPITFVFAASALGRLVTGGAATVGVRVPNHPMALALLQSAGVPLATTSVNRSGQEPATSYAESRALFDGLVDWLLDGGDCVVKSPSSVVDFSHYPFSILREGAISKKELERHLEAV